MLVSATRMPSAQGSRPDRHWCCVPWSKCPGPRLVAALKLGVIRQRDQRNLDLAPHRRFTLPAADSTALPISLPFSFTAMIIRRDPMLAAAFTLRAIGSVR
jgi:hypothetical protein